MLATLFLLRALAMEITGSGYTWMLRFWSDSAQGGCGFSKPPHSARSRSASSWAALRRAAPHLLLTGGKVFTADSTHPWAEALAIRGDRIVAVGTSAEVRHLAGRATHELALAGRVVIPGINDAHDHVGDVPLGVEFRTSAVPTPDPTFAQVRVIAARADGRLDKDRRRPARPR